MDKEKLKSLLEKAKVNPPKVETAKEEPKEEKEKEDKVDLGVLFNDAVYRNELLIRLDMLNATIQELNKTIKDLIE